MKEAEYQYVTGQARTSFPDLLATYQTLSDAAAQAASCTSDLYYGVGDRQTFDFFAADGSADTTVVYFHAGYWQSRDKSTFRFLAPAFTCKGINVAVVNYPLCPTVSIGELVEVTRASFSEVLRVANPFGRGSHRLIAAGHSAGGHIAVELALTDWVSRGFERNPIDAVIALSGVFNLTPLITTTLNKKLGLSGTTARQNSPVLRARAGLPRALFVVGAGETPAFVEQSRDMHNAWRSVDNDSELLIIDGADHFSLLENLVAGDSTLNQSVLGICSNARR